MKLYRVSLKADAGGAVFEVEAETDEDAEAQALEEAFQRLWVYVDKLEMLEDYDEEDA